MKIKGLNRKKYKREEHKTPGNNINRGQNHKSHLKFRGASPPQDGGHQGKKQKFMVPLTAMLRDKSIEFTFTQQTNM